MASERPAQQLLLLRHAKSDWSGDVGSDFERPLSERGRRDAPRMGRWMAQNGYRPEVVVASPSARTTETIHLICAALEYPLARVNYDRALYHGTAGRVHEVAAAQFQTCARLLVVAHNPGLEVAVRAYCPAAKPFADGKIMPTCTLAVIEFEGDGNDENGNLRVLMRPSELPE